MRLKVDVKTYIPIFLYILLKSNTLNLHERTFTSFNRKKNKKCTIDKIFYFLALDSHIHLFSRASEWKEARMKKNLKRKNN